MEAMKLDLEIQHLLLQDTSKVESICYSAIMNKVTLSALRWQAHSPLEGTS